MLQYDPQVAVRALCASDPRLAEVIRRAVPFSLKPKRMQSPFEALARAIVYQQLSGKAAATIFGRVQDLVGKKLDPHIVLQTDEDELRACGMSRPKVRYLKDLAGRTLDGTVPTLRQLRKMDDEEIVTRLTEVKGVGRWTVEMLLIFRLGRPDVFPVDDLGVRKGFQLTYKTRELPTPKQMHRRAKNWRPYRSVASWYLWRATETQTPG